MIYVLLAWQANFAGHVLFVYTARGDFRENGVYSWWKRQEGVGETSARTEGGRADPARAWMSLAEMVSQPML